MRPWMARAYLKAASRLPALQWGHGLAAVDGNTIWLYPFRAGMLQWGHGLAAVDGRDAVVDAVQGRGFNGATALRPWMASPTMRATSCTTRFNGATALRPWMGT